MTEADVRTARHLLGSAAQQIVRADRDLAGKILNFLNAPAEDNTGPRGTISEAELNRIRFRYSDQQHFRLLCTLLLETVRTGTTLDMIEDGLEWLRHIQFRSQQESRVRNEVAAEVAAALPQVSRPARRRITS